MAVSSNSQVFPSSLLLDRLNKPHELLYSDSFK